MREDCDSTNAVYRSLTNQIYTKVCSRERKIEKMLENLRDKIFDIYIDKHDTATIKQNLS